MCHTSNCRDQTLSILNYSDQVTVMKYFEFQSYDAEFHNGHIIFLHWLIGRLATDTDIQDTEGTDDLFSIPSNTGERTLSVLVWQCTGATTELLSTAVCVRVSVPACLWGKTEAGDSLKRWRVVAVFHLFDIIREQGLVFLRSTPDNKAWMTQCRDSALFQRLLVGQELELLSHLNTGRKNHSKKQDIMKMYLKVKLKMYGMNKKLKNKENMLWFWSTFDTKSFLLERKKYLFNQLSLAHIIFHCTFQSNS